MFYKLKKKLLEKKELMKKLNENKIYHHYKTASQLLDEVIMEIENKHYQYNVKTDDIKYVSFNKRKDEIKIEIISFTGDYFSLNLYDENIKIAKFYVDISYGRKGKDYAVIDVDGHYVQSEKLTNMYWEPAEELIKKLSKIGKIVAKKRKLLKLDGIELLKKET